MIVNTDLRTGASWLNIYIRQMPAGSGSSLLKSALAFRLAETALSATLEVGRALIRGRCRGSPAVSLADARNRKNRIVPHAVRSG